MIFNIRLSEKNIQIKSLYTEVYDLCKDYLTESENPDLVVEITEEDITWEREASDKHQEKYHTCYVFGDAYLETLAVYRKIVNLLMEDNVILMHGAVVKVGGSAFMFIAPSGTGKTTHTQMWVKEILGAEVINGDKPLIRIEDSDIIVYGTPWAGKESIQVNTSASLKAIFYLEQAEDNHVSQVAPDEAFPYLLQQSYRPEETEKFVKLLSCLNQIATKVSLFRLQCNKNPEAAWVAYEAVRNLIK